jgi:hypothetical protein
MSTRANVLINDGYDRLWFYRNSDGYPERTLPSLIEFMEGVSTGKIRGNVSQGAGWLIVIGHKEYDSRSYRDTWQVGAYEPTTDIHGDINFLYSIDLTKSTIVVSEVESVNEATGVPQVKIINELVFNNDGSYSESNSRA